MLFFARKEIMMKKSKVLIIEDDKFLLKLYSEKLQNEGFEVIESITGEEGLNKLFADKPDSIVLDLILPRKNGFEVLSEIKLNPETKNIPVIILTNLGQDTDIKRGLELGAATYLVKTEFSVNKLAEIIKEQLVKTRKKSRK